MCHLVQTRVFAYEKTKPCLFFHMQTLDEYKSQNLVLDYEIAPVHSAEVISVRFFSDEMGNDRVHVDVQFEGKQKFTLRDISHRAVGQEGDWQVQCLPPRHVAPCRLLMLLTIQV